MDIKIKNQFSYDTSDANDQFFDACCNLYRPGRLSSGSQFGFFKGVLDCITEISDDVCISYSRITKSFVAFYWDSIVLFHLKCVPSHVSRNFSATILNFVQKHALNDVPYAHFKHMTTELASLINELIRQNMDQITEDIFSATSGLLFTVNQSAQTLHFSASACQFLIENKTLLLQLNYLEFVNQLNELNPDYEFVELLLDMTEQVNDYSVNDLHYLFDVYQEKFKAFGLDLSSMRHLYDEYCFFQANDVEDAALIDRINNLDLSKISQTNYSVAPIIRKHFKIVNGMKVVERNARTAALALARADFKCEIDPHHVTFPRKKDHVTYTEPHYLVPMAYSYKFPVSLDVEANIVSLCPNCKKILQCGANAAPMIRKLYDARKKELELAGIHVSMTELLGMYGF